MIKNNPNKTPEEQRIAACRTSLNILGYRDVTEAKIRRKLKDRGYGEDIISEAIAFVKEKGYLNEYRMMVNAVESLARTRHMGKARIRAELVRREFSRDIIDMLDFGEEPLCDIDFPQLCAELILKRGGTADRKTYALLYRHGFSSDDIRRAKEILSDSGQLREDNSTEHPYDGDEFYE